VRARGTRAHRDQGPRPQSRRPPGEVRLPASEVAWLGVMAIALATDVGPGWVEWLLRGLGAAAIVWFVVRRVRYRRRRGEAVWLWDRI
jgi:hypothetical protein